MNKGLTKSYSVFLICFGFMSLVTESSNMFLFSYLLTDIGNQFSITQSYASMIGYVPLSSGVLGGQLMGFLADRWGRKYSLLVNLAISMIAMLIMGISNSIIVVILARLLSGITIAGVWTIVITYVSECIAPKNRSFYSSIVQIGFPAGNFLNALIFIGMAKIFGWRSCFIGIAVINFFLIIIGYLFLQESFEWRECRNQVKPPIYTIFKKPFLNFTVRTAIVSIMGVFAGIAVQTSTPLVLSVVNLPSHTFSASLLLIWTFAIAGYAVYGKLAQLMGSKRTLSFFMMSLTLVIWIISFKIYSHSQNVSLTSVVVFLSIAMFFTGYFPGFGIYYTSLFPTSIRSTAVGFCFNVGRIGNALGPFLLIFLRERFGLSIALIISVLPLLLSVIVLVSIPESQSAQIEISSLNNIKFLNSEKK